MGHTITKEGKEQKVKLEHASFIYLYLFLLNI